MFQHSLSKLQRLIKWTDTRAIFYILPLLILWLIAGTIAQKYLGLYQSLNIFFSFVYWIDGTYPVPSGLSLITALTLALTIQFLFKSEWSPHKIGIHISHLGMLVLMIGGLASYGFSEDGNIVILEGETSQIVSDYHKRELYIFENDVLIKRYNFNKFQKQTSINDDKFPFQIDILHTCHNCNIIKREDSDKGHELPLFSMAQFMALEPKAPEKEDERNLNGATLRITNTQSDQDGIYIVFEAMPKPIIIDIDDTSYRIILGKSQRQLPFQLQLDDFVKTNYPGTDKAKSYHSDVTVIDGDTSWPVRIEMNVPLRYKDYTFFQSSFIESELGTATVLSVVKNKNWPIPYIASTILVFGLLLHTFICLYQRKARAK